MSTQKPTDFKDIVTVVYRKFIIAPYILILFFGLFFSHTTEAQRKKKRNRSTNDQSIEFRNLSKVRLFEFPNVNKVPNFYDESELSTIIKLDRNKEWEKLYPKLLNYVKRFGIQNFYKDTYLLWRLAKLTETFGELSDAKKLYRLVLKHHREDIDIKTIELYYDSLTANDTDYYVPLDYYYELVEYRKAVDTLVPPRGVLINMGENVNSTYSDYAPSLGSDDQIMIFTSKRNIVVRDFSPVENEDLYFSNYSGVWEDAKEFKGVNSQYNEGSATITRDGKTLYFTRCESPDSYGHCDLFRARLQADSTWDDVKNLGANVNSVSWDSHPSLSHTEDTIFFASDRIGGFGLSDIYFTYKKDGIWQPAQNAGPIINTRGNDVSPFYHPVKSVLYFSSNGHLLNFGSFDIYKSRWLGRSGTEPINIGPLVNDSQSEFYFTIDAQSQNLFYAKSKDGNTTTNTDLYSFPLPMAAQPDAETVLSGSLLDVATDEPFEGIVSVIDLDNGIEVAPKYLRPDGSFEFNLINKQNYLLVIQGDNFFRIEELIFLDGDTEINRKAEHIASKLKFESIEFEKEKADLLPKMYGDLNKLSNFLLDHPDFSLKISGHTDSEGSPDFNLDLSQRRAEAIKEYITLFGGVGEERVIAEGYGSSRPIVEETNEEDAKLNRRVEFQIFRPKTDPN
ncbi:MAG: OmpA family protein [Bacteroidota bacterium]